MVKRSYLMHTGEMSYLNDSIMR